MVPERGRIRITGAVTGLALASMIAFGSSSAAGTSSPIVISDFEDGTPQGWFGSTINPPANVASGGPTGAGDNYLKLVATGSSGGGGKLVFMNEDDDWTGDLGDAGARTARAMLRNPGPNPLELRVVIHGAGGGFTSQPRPVAVGGGWRSIEFPIGPDDLTPTPAHQFWQPGTNVDATLGAVNHFRILHTTQVSFNGQPIVAELHIDDIALTGPSCAGRAVTVDLGAGDSPTPGNDVILGTAMSETINALTGADVVCAGGGGDTITGGPGNDIIYGEGGNDTVDGNGGNDAVFGGGGADDLRGGGGADDVIGNGGNDVLIGHPGDDFIDGGDGADIINGGGDEDEILGGGGADVIVGGPGNDLIDGDGGPDTINGAAGDDTLDGGTGTDTIRGAGGDDTLLGGSGDDPLLSGGAGTDVVNGGGGDDTLQGNKGHNDLLLGAGGDDRLNGGTGTDSLDGGPDADTCNGGVDGHVDSAIRCETLVNVP